MFYKIVFNNIIIDIITNPVYVRYMFKSKRFIKTDIDSAHGVLDSGHNNVYLFTPIDGLDNKIVSMIEISENEYLNLKSQMTESTVDVSGNLIGISELQEQKVKEMSVACNQIITKGFDIILSDGVQYHFSLEITDQLKISKLNDRAMQGITILPWHSDNGLCKFYSPEDIMAINTQMEYLIEYHTTYFNSLKNYILNMDDRVQLMNVYYGMEIPMQYQSEVLKILVGQMNGQ